MNLKLLTITVLWLFQIPIWAQVHCEVSNTQEAPLVYTEFSSRSYRQQATRIAVLPTILHQTNGEQIFTEADVKELINKANEYFAPIKYEFYIANQGVRHVYNDEFYNLEIEKENDLREIYDVDYAINLYFLHSIRKPNKDILSGFTSLPSLNGISNRIMLSYLDKNKADFESLRDKIFPHELGHYFGLLHTFQDSNAEDISKRELVTRAIGSNCSTTGDYLCDTDSDPYERFPSISTLGCNNTLPSSYTDALGSRYTPPTNNLMSYNIRCDHVFTTQQYERMQAAGSVRFSPEADYQIIQQQSNSITIEPLVKRLFCEGETISFIWKAHGFFARNNSFTVELTIDEENTQTLEAAFVGDEVFVQVPKGIEPNTSYRMRILSSNPGVQSQWSEHFEIQNVGIAELSSATNEINLGNQVSLKLQITGSGPWDVTLSDGSTLKNLRKSEVFISKSPTANTQFSISSISNACGSLEKKGLVSIGVAEANLLVNGGSHLTACEQGFIELPVSGLRTDADLNYRVHLKGKKEFIIVPVVSNNRMYFSLPRELKPDEDIKLEVIGEGLGNFSSPINLEILSKPRQPYIQSPVTFCYDTTDTLLSAGTDFGNQTRWYNESLSLIGDKGVVNTNSPGISNYFVSQISSAGCESEKSKIEVEIKEPLRASISGDQNIFKGDSAQLRLDIAGEGPFEVVLNDGSAVLVDQPSLLYYVKPSDSFTYEIRHVKNQCGFGNVAGAAEVQVIVLLSTEADSDLKIFPNPSNGEFHIDQSIVIQSIVDQKGVQIPFVQKDNAVSISAKGIFFITGFKRNHPELLFTMKVIAQ